MKSKFENDENLLKADGKIKFKLGDILKEKNISKYKLSRITGIRYETICNYCNGNTVLINKVYLTILCEVLECQISDIIEYISNE